MTTNNSGLPRFYGTQRWKTIRYHYLRANPLCKHCEIEGIVKEAKQVDHIKPISEGGSPDSYDNLQGLCTTHHSRKTRLENQPKKQELTQALEYADTVVGTPTKKKKDFNKK